MRLRLSPVAIATAAAFSHRFFAVRSMARNCRALVAAAALFLAGKTEETPARAREVLAAVDALVPLRVFHCEREGSEGGGGEQAGRREGENGEEARERQPSGIHLPLTADEAAMLSAVDALMTAERALLYALGFRLDVEHPFRTALSLAKAHGDAATVGLVSSNSSLPLTSASATDGNTAAKNPPPASLPGPGAKVLA